MACANPDFAALYTNALPVNTWPQQPYPTLLGPFLSGSALMDAQKAWAFYEQVEAYDAQQRQSMTPTWFIILTTSDALLYRRGQLLHVSVCPCVDWTSQRYLPLIGMGGDVRPQLCV